jgi:biopolymer transport protein ExbD
MRHRRSRARRHEVEINVTAFMNLMVVLVPFLLVMAVFSRLAILELNLPSGEGANQQPEQQGLKLEVVVYDDALVVNSRPGELLKRIPNAADGPDLDALTALLKQVKSRFPDRLDATILLEPEISYDMLVQVMDSVRMTRVVQNGEAVKAELFPEISIGDAPIRSQQRAG